MKTLAEILDIVLNAAIAAACAFILFWIAYNW